MLSETKEQIKTLVDKVQLLDFVMGTLDRNHKEFSDRVETQYKQASNHKLKLTDEILRIAGATELKVVDTK